MKKRQQHKKYCERNINWREELNSYSLLSKDHIRCCEVLLAAEVDQANYDYILILKICSNYNHNRFVNFISFDGILEDIRNPCLCSNAFVDTSLNAIYNLALVEARSSINSGSPLSSDIIAQLIKLKIMQILYSNVEYVKSPPIGSIRKMGRLQGHIIYDIERTDFIFILLQFYNPVVFIELYKIGVRLFAVIELIDTTNKDATDDMIKAARTNTVTSPITKEIHKKFWFIIHKLLEGRLFTECLQNAAHIKIPIISVLQVRSLDLLSKSCYQVRHDILTAIDQLRETKQLNDKYLKTINICKLEPEPKNIRVAEMRTYKKLMNSVPPDAFTVGLLLYCLLEEIGVRSKQKIKEIRQSKVEHEARGRTNSAQTVSCSYKPYINNYYPMIALNILDHKKHIFDPKLKLKLSKGVRRVQESNKLECMISNYPQLSPKLLEINFNILKLYPEITVFDIFTPLESISAVLKNIAEQSWKGDPSSLFLKMAFNKLKNTPVHTFEEIEQLEYELFVPLEHQKNDLSVLPKIELQCRPRLRFPLPSKLPKVLVYVPPIQYNDPQHICGSTNIETYRWCEKLEPNSMLQCIQQASIDYNYCTYTYCPVSDAFVLRYHNNIDAFGINIERWNEILCTPLALRDFCKYVISNHSQCKERIETYTNKDEILFEKLNAFDTCSTRIQLTGAQIVFQSMDGYTVTVENIKFITEHLKISLAVKIANCMNLYLDYKKSLHTDCFNFRIMLPDGTTMIFFKPQGFKSSRKKIDEYVYKILERKMITGAATKQTPYSLNPHLPSCDRDRTYLALILKQIKKAKMMQKPMFKIYSSKLHKLKYIKAVKSYIHIQLEGKTIALLCNHPAYKITKVSQIKKTKRGRFKDPVKEFPNQNYFDFHLSLPSGLCITTCSGISNALRNVKQKYVDKGPACKHINDEIYRIYSRNGCVIKRKITGTVQLLFCTGTVIEFTIPYCKTERSRKYVLGRYPNIKMLTSHLKSKIHNSHILERRLKHLIGSSESRYYRHDIYERLCKCKKKKRRQNCILHYKEITERGIRYDVINGVHITCKDGLYYEMKHESVHEIFEQIDQHTTRLIRDDGRMITTFADQTKITTWFEVASDLVIEGEDINPVIVDKNGIHARKNCDTGWVYIRINYIYEHPMFATVLYTEKYDDAKILLSDKLKIILNVTGDCQITIDQDLKFHMDNKRLTIENRPCQECEGITSTDINIQQLYNADQPLKHNTELLRTHDTYDKIFTINYDGNCFRNDHYLNTSTNRFGCKYHCAEYQRLLILNKNHSGSKLLDINAYHKLVQAAILDINTQINFSNNISEYHSLHIQKIHRSPYKSLLPRLELKKKRFVFVFEDNEECYVTLRDIVPILKFSYQTKKNARPEISHEANQDDPVPPTTTDITLNSKLAAIPSTTNEIALNSKLIPVPSTSIEDAHNIKMDSVQTTNTEIAYSPKLYSVLSTGTDPAPNIILDPVPFTCIESAPDTKSDDVVLSTSTENATNPKLEILHQEIIGLATSAIHYGEHKDLNYYDRIRVVDAIMKDIHCSHLNDRDLQILNGRIIGIKLLSQVYLEELPYMLLNDECAWIANMKEFEEACKQKFLYYKQRARENSKLHLMQLAGKRNNP